MGITQYKGRYLEKADKLLALFSKERINGLYAEWKDDKKIKWKDELKRIFGDFIE